MKNLHQICYILTFQEDFEKNPRDWYLPIAKMELDIYILTCQKVFKNNLYRSTATKSNRNRNLLTSSALTSFNFVWVGRVLCFLAGSTLVPFARCYLVVSLACGLSIATLCAWVAAVWVPHLLSSIALLMLFGQNILQMMRRHFFKKVWSLCVMELETNHVSLPYINIQHELNIRSFERPKAVRTLLGCSWHLPSHRRL